MAANQNPPQGSAADNGNALPPNSELQLVSSLAKLQELERKIHELRQFMPDELLEPLVPIANPERATVNNPVAETPRALRADLTKTAHARVADVQHFQALWRDPELKSVWEHVESRVNEPNGQILQPTGKWDKDYDVLLKELTEKEKSNVEERQREEEEAERLKVQSGEYEWQKVLGSFVQRNVPGVRIAEEEGGSSLTVALVKAGIVFLVKGVSEDGAPISEWEVSSKLSGRAPTKLETAILDCLGSRPRKWDLSFLLDMISSYAEIKHTPCIKCSQVTNSGAQLPTLRRPQLNQQFAEGEPRIYAFDVLHSGCA